MARPRFRWPPTCTLILLVGAGLLGGCHKIFGEYEVLPEPPPVPPPTTLCVGGDLRCVGPFLYQCGPALDSWVFLATCTTDARCRSSEGGCKTCVPGEYRCVGTGIEVCSDNGAWAPAEDCGAANVCNLNSDSCLPCTADEYQCQEGALMRCTAGAWALQQQCVNEAACSVSADKTTGACAATDPRCTAPLMHVCDGTQLLRCTQERDRLVVVENCGRGEGQLCDAAAADQQAADDLLGTCVEVCEPDAIRCVDAAPQRCSADGRWEPDAAAGPCESGECPTPGQTRCNRGIERCDQSEWNALGDCPGDLCNANDAKCEPLVCEKDAVRCWEGNLERCDDSLASWNLAQKCGEGETCSLEGCTKSACDDGDVRCNDVYRETCVGGAWERTERCATAALCDPEQPTCEAPECEAYRYYCDGSTLKRCWPDRTGYDVRGDCTAAGKVCDERAWECVDP